MLQVNNSKIKIYILTIFLYAPQVLKQQQQQQQVNKIPITTTTKKCKNNNNLNQHRKSSNITHKIIKLLNNK